MTAGPGVAQACWPVEVLVAPGTRLMRGNIGMTPQNWPMGVHAANGLHAVAAAAARVLEKAALLLLAIAC